MRVSKNVALATVLSLFVGLFSPQASWAHDPGLVTKTVKVLNHQGQPYGAGAEVAPVFKDHLNDFSTSPVVLTGANGEASFAVRPTTEFIGIAVAPSQSDAIHALDFLDAGADFPQGSETSPLSLTRN